MGTLRPTAQRKRRVRALRYLHCLRLLSLPRLPRLRDHPLSLSHLPLTNGFGSTRGVYYRDDMCDCSIRICEEVESTLLLFGVSQYSHPASFLYTSPTKLQCHVTSTDECHRASQDPFRGGENVIVLCETCLPTGEPIPSNTRAKAREAFDAAPGLTPWFGIEQEYTLFDKDMVSGWVRALFLTIFL